MTQTEFDPTSAADGTGAGPGCGCPGSCGSTARPVSRRAALGVGVVAGAALVTACGSSDTAPPSASTASNPASRSSTPATSAAPSSAGSSTDTASSATSAPSAAPAGPRIAALSDIPSGGSLIVADGDQQIALARAADGTVVAHTAVCTHQGCAVDADGATLRCPCHGSVFDAFTGAVVRAPANAPLAEIAVEVSAEAVHLSV